MVKYVNVLSLVLVNLIPLLGIAFLDWDLYSMMVLYWLENIVIGAYNLVKIAFAAKGRNSLGDKLSVGSFFILHYGFFSLVHGIFVIVIFQPGGPFSSSFAPVDILRMGFARDLAIAFRWALLAMALSHGISLATNYFGQKEYLNSTVHEQMFKPYNRIMMLHVTIMAGGFATMLLGAPVLALVFMVILKIIIDIKAHEKAHQQAQAPKTLTI